MNKEQGIINVEGSTKAVLLLNSSFLVLYSLFNRKYPFTWHKLNPPLYVLSFIFAPIMEKVVQNVVTVYAESTPNPAAMKFVASRMLIDEGSVEYLKPEEAANCPLAIELFKFDGVASVFITANFVTVNKLAELDWYELIPILREYIKGYLESGEKIFTGPAWQKAAEKIVSDSDDHEIEERIIQALEEYVRPAVEQDGGAIHFKSFDDGVVTLVLKGSCSGCPSSLVTLKSGIERLLTKLIPEVEEVVAEEQ